MWTPPARADGQDGQDGPDGLPGSADLSSVHSPPCRAGAVGTRILLKKKKSKKIPEIWWWNAKASELGWWDLSSENSNNIYRYLSAAASIRSKKI